MRHIPNLCYIIFSVLIISFPCISTAQENLYAHGIGGASHNDAAVSIVDDNFGNTYVLGFFSGSVDFDFSSGSFVPIESNGNSIDVFLAKLNANGDCLWAKNIGGEDNEIPRKMVIDDDGNIYITGYFSGETDLDPASTEAIFGTPGGKAAFVAKYNFDGAYIWGNAMEVTNFIDGEAVGVDHEGNVITSGWFSGNLNFDSSTNADDLASPSGVNMYLAKYNAGGDFLWSKQSTGKAQPEALAIDKNNNIYVGGIFSDATDFDPSSNNAIIQDFGDQDIFIAKYTPNGDYVMAKAIGGISSDYLQDIVVDGNMDIYITGDIHGPADFDPSQATVSVNVPPGYNTFLAKYDSIGNYIWVSTFNNVNGYGHGLTLDEFGYIYMLSDINTGQGPITISTTPHIITVQGSGYGTLLSKFSPDGTCLHAKTLSTSLPSNVMTYSIDYLRLNLSSDNTLSISGTISGKYDFDPSSDSSIIITEERDGFAGKYKLCNEEAVSATLNGTVISTNASGSYVWFDCNENKIIPNEVGASYQVTRSGSYAVIVNNDFCSVKSNCIEVGFADISEYSTDNSIRIYPNPTTHLLYIDGKEKYGIQIFSVEGKLVYSENASDKTLIDVSSFPNGLYTIRTTSADAVIRSEKFIKQ